MADGITVTITGLDELKQALDELPKATSRRVQERALLKAAQPIVAAAKAKAPVDTGDLRESIHATTTPPGNVQTSREAYGAVMRAGGSIGEARAASRAASRPVEVFVGPGRNPQGMWMEFGTSRTAPRPYLRPAWEENKDKVPEAVGRELQSEILKAVERRATRQANRAARVP